LVVVLIRVAKGGSAALLATNDTGRI